MRWKTPAEIYKMHSFAPFWNRVPKKPGKTVLSARVFVEKITKSLLIFANFVKMLLDLRQILVRQILLEFRRNFVGIFKFCVR